MITFSNLEKFGRLGNQLFQISAVFSHARRNGFDYIFPEWSYNKYLDKPIPTSNVTYNLQRYRENDAFTYSRIIGDNIDLTGYFQNEMYFSDYREAIKDLFEPNSNIKDLVNSSLPQGRLTSIHVRRGDYIKFPNHHPIIDHSYYTKAIDMLKDQTDHYIVFSDDIEWCKNNFPSSFMFSSERDEFVDLYKMSLCENHIIANSSFSWWGSYLSRKLGKVIAPDPWVGISYEKTGWRGIYRKEMIII
jgi:hypothetical protein